MNRTTGTVLIVIACVGGAVGLQIVAPCLWIEITLLAIAGLGSLS